MLLLFPFQLFTSRLSTYQFDCDPFLIMYSPPSNIWLSLCLLLLNADEASKNKGYWNLHRLLFWRTLTFFRFYVPQRTTIFTPWLFPPRIKMLWQATRAKVSIFILLQWWSAEKHSRFLFTNQSSEPWSRRVSRTLMWTTFIAGLEQFIELNGIRTKATALDLLNPGRSSQPLIDEHFGQSLTLPWSFRSVHK